MPDNLTNSIVCYEIKLIILFSLIHKVVLQNIFIYAVAKLRYKQRNWLLHCRTILYVFFGSLHDICVDNAMLIGTLQAFEDNEVCVINAYLPFQGVICLYSGPAFHLTTSLTVSPPPPVMIADPLPAARLAHSRYPVTQRVGKCPCQRTVVRNKRLTLIHLPPY